jgi:outer membrane biogenesis lipoprotein LolB
MALLHNDRLRRFRWAFRAVIVLLALSGCAHWPSADAPEAREGQQALERLQSVNADLSACKGLGQVILTTQEGIQRARLVWAVQGPDKLRLELLAVSGHPLAALASDGTHLYLRDNMRDRFHKSRSSASLKPLIHIPLDVHDLIAYLLGRVPLIEADRIWLIDNPQKPGYILNLNRWWEAGRQRILLAADGISVERVIRLDADGEPTYWVELGQRQPEGEYSFPRWLRAVTKNGHRLEIQMERFWPNARIEEAAFRLTP